MDREKSLGIIAQICGKEAYDSVDEFAYDYAERLIKNYCNIDEVCTELEQTLIDMACELEKAGGYCDEAGGGIKQIREGDVTVSFGSGDEAGIWAVKNFEKQLMNFRRPKW
jgi:hypothetical protein